MKCNIKSKRLLRIAMMSLAMALPVAAQDNATPIHPHAYHHYQLMEVGTFGGPSSWLDFPTVVLRSGYLNNQGVMTGSADTAEIDPYCAWGFDCHATHGFQWKKGTTTDLGVLPGGIGSQVNWISASGLMVGIADNGQQDPLSGGLQIHGVLWKDGTMSDLGALFGGYDTWALAVNSRGEIVGGAYNTIPDPNSMFGYGYQYRAFYWNNGVAQDLGTLGTGNDAAAGVINERGQVIGLAFTSSTPDSTCTIYNWNPFLTYTTGSFLWDKKNGMKDIGGLGGACTVANDLNNQGQVVGTASLPGDTQFHPFVWNAATGMTDLLDPSDPSFGWAFAENARGDITGQICDSVTCWAVLWQNRGGHWERTDLSTSTQGAFGFSVNASQQVAGVLYYANGSAAAFAEGGGPTVDLNTLIPAGSGLYLVEADQINDRGEISAEGPDANGNNHVVVLIPCDGNHPDVEGCDYSMVDASISVAQRTPAVRGTSTSRLSHSLMRRMNRYRFPVNSDGSNLTRIAKSVGACPDGNCVSTAWGGVPAKASARTGNATHTLTGYCYGTNLAGCFQLKDPIQCPAGTVAKTPIHETFDCPHHEPQQEYVDSSRGCQVKNRLGTVYGLCMVN